MKSRLLCSFPLDTRTARLAQGEAIASTAIIATVASRSCSSQNFSA